MDYLEVLAIEKLSLLPKEETSIFKLSQGELVDRSRAPRRLHDHHECANEIKIYWRYVKMLDPGPVSMTFAFSRGFEQI